MVTAPAVAALIVLAATCAWSYTDLDDPADPWLTSRTGITQQVPHPFEPLRVDGVKVSCWGRQYTLGAPLPAQVTSQGEALLAGPMRVVATIGGEQVTLSGAPVELTATRGDRVEFSGSCPAGAATIESAGWLEYDGAMQVNLTMRGQVSLQRLAIEIPCRPQTAPFLYVGHQWGQDFYERVGAEPGWSWEYGWQATAWLGDDYRGLSFFTESYRDWVGPDPGRLRVERTADEVLFRATIVSEPVQVDGARTWTLGLQATPGKPLPATWHGRHVGQGSADETLEGARERYETGQRVALIWSHGTRWFSFPQAKDREAFVQAVRNYHEAGLKVVVYINLSAPACPAAVLQPAGHHRDRAAVGRPARLPALDAEHPGAVHRLDAGPPAALRQRHVPDPELDGPLMAVPGAARACGEVVVTDPLAQVEVPPLGKFMVLTVPANSFRVVEIGRSQ